jgi:hypothetical protein
MLPGRYPERLVTAVAVLKAAEACQARRTDQALTIALHVERPLYEVTTHLNAAARRIHRNTRMPPSVGIHSLEW